MADDLSDVNPYAPPTTPLGPVEEPPESEPVASTSVLQKYGEAFRLLFSHLSLFSLLILTVWLPGNLLINALIFHGSGDGGEMRQFQLNNLIEGIFGPIYAAGMIYALSRIKSGRRVTYLEAIGVGFRRWGSLLGTRWMTGLLIGLGLIALIVPGILLALRFALIDPVVVLEGRSGSAARQRSADLTRGRRGSIFGAYFLFGLLILPLSIAIGILYEEIESLNNMWAGTILDCVLDIASSLILIVVFLFYREASPSTTEPETATAQLFSRNPDEVRMGRHREAFRVVTN